MTWARFDDGIYDHPKVIQAGRDARELFFASVVYSSRHLTDGLIPRGALRILQAWTEIEDTAACADRLIEVGLWESDGANYRIHDFLDYQPTADEVKAKREARSEAGRKGGVRSGEVRAARAEREANEAKREAIASALVEAKREANAKQNRTPSQTRPLSPNDSSGWEDSSSSFGADAHRQDEQPVTDDLRSQTDEPDAQSDAPSLTPPAPIPKQDERQSERQRAAAANPLWDALVEVFGYTPRTQPECNKWGGIVKHLKAAKATPEDVRRAKTHYDAGVALGVYTWNLTPNALDSHLGELLQPPQANTKGKNGGNGNGKHAENGRYTRQNTMGGGATPARFTPEYYARAAEGTAGAVVKRNGG